MKMEKKRLAYSRKLKHWAAADWEKVMYSDESTFRVTRATRTLA
jgi:hypothetical protein